MEGKKRKNSGLYFSECVCVYIYIYSQIVIGKENEYFTAMWDKRLQEKEKGGCPRGVMIKTMDCGIVVSEFKLQSHYYVHFWTNPLGKGILPAIG